MKTLKSFFVQVDAIEKRATHLSKNDLEALGLRLIRLAGKVLKMAAKKKFSDLANKPLKKTG